MGATVLVLGGRSEIGLAVARRLAARATVVLAARRSTDLDTAERSLRHAGASAVDRVEFDADDLDAHRPVPRRRGAPARAARRRGRRVRDPQ